MVCKCVFLRSMEHLSSRTRKMLSLTTAQEGGTCRKQLFTSLEDDINENESPSDSSSEEQEWQSVSSTDTE